MLLEVEEAKDLTIVEKRGEFSADVAGVICPNCQQVTYLPEREQRVALNLRESVPNDNYLQPCTLATLGKRRINDNTYCK